MAEGSGIRRQRRTSDVIDSLGDFSPENIPTRARSCTSPDLRETVHNFDSASPLTPRYTIVNILIFLFLNHINILKLFNTSKHCNKNKIFNVSSAKLISLVWYLLKRYVVRMFEKNLPNNDVLNMARTESIALLKLV